MTSQNNCSKIPDNYKEITEYRPSCDEYSMDKEDQCCDYFMCLVFSPLVSLVWTGCCLCVTTKKIKNRCSNTSCNENKTEKNEQIITTQPEK